MPNQGLELLTAATTQVVIVTMKAWHDHNELNGIPKFPESSSMPTFSHTN